MSATAGRLACGVLPMLRHKRTLIREPHGKGWNTLCPLTQVGEYFMGALINRCHQREISRPRGQKLMGAAPTRRAHARLHPERPTGPARPLWPKARCSLARTRKRSLAETHLPAKSTTRSRCQQGGSIGVQWVRMGPAAYGTQARRPLR
jgi:hypothetical protein